MSQGIMLRILVIASALAVCVQAKCQSKTYYATTVTKGLLYYDYDNNEDCTFNILPYNAYASGYYLEIIWKTFGITGNMPNCFDDYVEVFLTK